MAANHNNQPSKKKGKTVARYEADKGALSISQLKQIKTLTPQYKSCSVRTSLFEESAKR